ncbi:Bifunctional protein [Streptococcus gordonii]|uniref:Bifunctional protein n=1 Tax=Streptococcus gordonii TaxID=1302 RepID=A0A139N518_STRGN|nr:Bifunctional protein [Streptococcus gordonii]
MVVQAIQYSRFGDEEVLDLVNIKSDVLEVNQVRVEVYAVGLNPIDYKTFEGAKPLQFLSFMTKLKQPSRWFESKSSLFPRGVGRDFAGVITEIGEGVSRFAVGDKVFGTIISDPGLGTKRGALATEVCINESGIVLKPEMINMNHAATMGVASLTVGGAFRKIELSSKDVVVISAAAGGIGSIAVQYAVAKGATVIGIARKKNSEYLKSLGAIPVAYEENIQNALLSASAKPITKCLDCYGSDYVKLAFSLGLKGSEIGTLVPSPYVMIRGAQFTGPRHSTYDDFKVLAEMVSDGKVRLNIDQVYDFSLKSVREAYRSLKLGHTRGKKVVKVRG